jgi:hypothetical protein
MEAKPLAAANCIYDDFDPPSNWAREPEHDTLILELPGLFLFFFNILLSVHLCYEFEFEFSDLIFYLHII